MKKAYILMQGHYGESYPLAIFTRKKTRWPLPEKAEPINILKTMIYFMIKM